MRVRRLFLAELLLAGACAPPVQVTPPPASAPPELVALAGASVLIGAGDIGDCTTTGDEGTAAIVDSVLVADSAAKVEDAVFTLGDNAYPVGSAANFNSCFTPTWGDTTRHIMGKIHPSPGNHEHETDRAAPYYRYFGKRAGDPDKGYYSYDVGQWHVAVLNSAIAIEAPFSAADRDAQEQWLKADLTDHATKCTLAYWHHPRFSSGYHGSDARLQSLWQILYDANVDLVLNGHDHDYERMLPMTPAGVLDTLRGITEIVVGTGGGGLRGYRNPPAGNSAVRIQGHFGVLKLTLGAGEYQRAFIDVTGRLWDLGGGRCH
jgi:Calcineurin-like phosphoesterase